MERIGEADRGEDIHTEVLTLKAFAAPILRRDQRFQDEWEALNKRMMAEARRDAGRADAEVHVDLEWRLDQLGLIVECLHRHGILGEKIVPHSAADELERPVWQRASRNGEDAPPVEREEAA